MITLLTCFWIISQIFSLCAILHGAKRFEPVVQNLPYT
jgi:hypothetical protein